MSMKAYQIEKKVFEIPQDQPQEAEAPNLVETTLPEATNLPEVDPTNALAVSYPHWACSASKFIKCIQDNPHIDPDVCQDVSDRTCVAEGKLNPLKGLSEKARALGWKSSQVKNP